MLTTWIKYSTLILADAYTIPLLLLKLLKISVDYGYNILLAIQVSILFFPNRYTYTVTACIYYRLELLSMLTLEVR